MVGGEHMHLDSDDSLIGEHTTIVQSWMPLPQTYELGLSRFGYSADRDVQMGDYIPVSESPRRNT